MDLKTWRIEQDWNYTEAAEFAGLSNGKAWARYETGERYPRPDFMAKLERLTSGKVTASDMLKTRRAWEKTRAQRRADKAKADA